MRDNVVILSVDDDPYIIRLVKLILSKNTDWEIVSATNGKEGIEAARKHKPDLILLDVSMPKLDGYKACKIIKEDDTFKDTPVIFLTTLSDKQDIVQGFNLGAVDFISKPFFPQELISRLQVHIQVKQQKDIINKHLRENQELLQVLCHDLANPLSSMAGIMQIAGKDMEMMEKFKPLLDSSVDNMNEMISLVRNFRAINDGKYQIKLSPVCLKKALNESCQTLDHQLVKKQITINDSVEEETLVMADKTSLVNSVLNNLITNAIKFSHPGSEIFVSTEAQENDLVVLKIKDNGIGMPQAILENLFSMNIPTSRSGTSDESGTGYGMPLVKKFMSHYNGEIKIDSIQKTDESTDHGTTVQLTFDKASWT